MTKDSESKNQQTRKRSDKRARAQPKNGSNDNGRESYTSAVTRALITSTGQRDVSTGMGGVFGFKENAETSAAENERISPTNE